MLRGSKLAADEHGPAENTAKQTNWQIHTSNWTSENRSMFSLNTIIWSQTNYMRQQMDRILRNKRTFSGAEKSKIRRIWGVTFSWALLKFHNLHCHLWKDKQTGEHWGEEHFADLAKCAGSLYSKVHQSELVLNFSLHNSLDELAADKLNCLALEALVYSI